MKIVDSIIGIPLGFGAICFRAFVLTKLWAWYIQGPLHQDPLSMLGAIGLVIFGTLLTKQVSVSDIILLKLHADNDFVKLIANWSSTWGVIISVCMSASALLMGWLYWLILR